MEDGLRHALAAAAERRPYRLPDCRVGDVAATDPLASLSWPELRDLIYGDPGTR